MPTASMIGARLRELREERGWSVAELAREAGVDRNSISQVEKGASTAPSFPNGVRLAIALGIAPEYLAGLTDEKRPYSQIIPEGEIEGPGGLKIRREGSRIDVIPAPGQVLYGGDIDELANNVADAMLPMIGQILRRRAGRDPKRLALVEQLFGPETSQSES